MASAWSVLGTGRCLPAPKSSKTVRRLAKVTSAEATTKSVVDEFVRRLSGRGGSPVELFGESVDHYVPGSPTVPWTGRRTTRREVQEFFSQLAAHLEPRNFSVRKSLIDGGDAVILGDFAYTVRANGKPFEGQFALHLSVEDSQIVRYHMYEDSYALAAALT